MSLTKLTLLMQTVRWTNGLRRNFKESFQNSTKDNSKMDQTTTPVQDSGVEENSDYIGQNKFLKRKDARNAALIRMGHEGIMMEKHMRQARIVEDTVKGLQKQAGYEVSEQSEEADDMGVNIGNETHYHIERKEEPAPQLPQPQPQQTNKSLALPASILGAAALVGGSMFMTRKPDTATQPQPQQVIVQPSKNPYIATDVGVGFGEVTPIPPDELEEMNK